MMITHRPERDGSIIESNHVPYYLALEYAADAWGTALVDTCGGLLGPRDLAVVHADCDFRHELFIGEVDLDVTLVKLGASSLRWHVELAQEGRHAGTVVAVVCRVDDDRVTAVPLSAEQRRALETLLGDAPASADQTAKTAPFQ
jgi:acyl-CoA thioesterase FadM